MFTINPTKQSLSVFLHAANSFPHIFFSARKKKKEEIVDIFAIIRLFSIFMIITCYRTKEGARRRVEKRKKVCKSHFFITCWRIRWRKKNFTTEQKPSIFYTRKITYNAAINHITLCITFSLFMTTSNMQMRKEYFLKQFFSRR